MDFETTIVAVSSASGFSSHALVRVSGSRALEGAGALGLCPQLRNFVTGRLKILGNELPVFVGSFKASNSYTGQDTVEILMVNNKSLIDEVVKSLIKNTNGRLAEAGEFTARSFVNGNISLSAAEGVCASISASNDRELQGAALLRDGVLAKLVEQISSELTRALALVEAGIDFTDEEDVIAITEEDLLCSLQLNIDAVKNILENKISMAQLRVLPSVVLAGKPNAGKSTLFNALIEKERSVTSNLSGTTRDAIIEQVHFGSYEVLLIDVAGKEIPTSELSSSMQSAANMAVKNSDLLLWCVAPCDDDSDKPKNSIVVYTKGDLKGASKDAVCATTGVGIPELKKKIDSLLSHSPTPKPNTLALLSRHENYLQKALQSLCEAKNQLQTPELVAASLRESLNSIGAITGQVTPDEIIGEVFSTFCVGK
jgi:tRNA modification GTPase